MLLERVLFTSNRYLTAIGHVGKLIFQRGKIARRISWATAFIVFTAPVWGNT